MLSKTPFRIAGAAMLGTVALLGTNAANAQIGLDENGRVTGAAVYAQETLVMQANDDLEGYYTLTEGEGGAAHNVTVGDLDYDAGDSLRMTVTLNGLVFAEALTEADATIPAAQSGSIDLLGGGVGESVARFTLTAGGTADADLTVNIGNLAIASGTDSGSIMISVTNSTDETNFGAGVNTKESNYPGAVKVVKGLAESFEGINAEAAVTTGFKEFNSGTDTVTYAALGTLNLSVTRDVDATDGSAQYVRDAVNGARLTNDDTATTGLPRLIEHAAGALATAMTSSFTISGNFSFASAAWLEDVVTTDGADPACMGGAAAAGAVDATNTGNIIQEEDDVVQMDLAAQNVVSITGATSKTFCMSVGGEDDEDAMKIEAGSYSVTTDYDPTGENQAFSAMSDTHALGMITRDGTTVRIPFITTNPALKQRITVNNRSGGPVTFEFSFEGEGDAMATATMMASGDTQDDTGMPEGVNSYLVSDLVTISGSPKRGAAEFVAEAGAGQIDVSTTINDGENGGAPTIQKLTAN